MKHKTIKKKWLCPFKEYMGGDREILKINDIPYIFSKDWENESIEEKFSDLRKYKCNPSISLRGNKWRININSGTNVYEDSRDICVAFRKAHKVWLKAGMPTASGERIILFVKEYRDERISWRNLEWRII